MNDNLSNATGYRLTGKLLGEGPEERAPDNAFDRMHRRQLPEGAQQAETFPRQISPNLRQHLPQQASQKNRNPHMKALSRNRQTMTNFPRRFLGLVAAALFSLGLSAKAQTTYTYSGANGSSWLNSSNWTGGTANTFPGVDANTVTTADGTTADIAQFSNDSSVSNVGINFNSGTGSGVGNSGKANGQLSLAAISFNGTGDFQLGSSSSAGILVLNGGTFSGVQNVILQNVGANTLTLANQNSGTTSSQTMAIALGNTSNNVVRINGSGGINITSVIQNGAGSNLALVGAGSGVLTLAGANTYTGTTTITQGILSAAKITVGSSNSSLGNATSAVVLGGATTAGTLSYTGGVTTFNRGFTVNAGGGQISNTSGTGILTIGTGAISNGGTLTLAANSSGIAVTSGISGTGGLAITSGLVTLSGTNSYTGSTASSGSSTLNATTASLNGADTTNGISFNTGTLQAGSGGISTAKAITMIGAGTFDTNGNNSSLSGNFTGSGTLTKSGSGVLTLSGSNGSYTGALTVSVGTLKLGSATALGSTSAGTTISSGAVLDLNGQPVGAEAVSLSGTGISSGGGLINGDAVNTASLSGVVTVNGTSSLGGAGSFTLSSGIVGAGATNALVKVGAGTVTLSAAAGTNRSVSTATTQVNGGVLRLTNATALNTGTTAVVTIGAGVLELANGITFNEAIALNDGGTFRSDGNSGASNNTFGTGGGSITVANAGSETLSTVNSADVFTVSGIITGGTTSTTLNVSGPGTVDVTSSSNTYAGAWKLNAGTLRLGATNALGNTTHMVSLNGGTLAGRLTTNTDFSPTASSLVVTANSGLTSDRTSLGAGVTYTFGTLNIGTNQLNVTTSAAATSGTGGITLGATTLTGNPTFNVTNGATATTLFTLGALNDGSTARTITKSGDGTLTLGTNATSLVSGTVVNIIGGTLNSNTTTALGSMAAMNISSGATFGVGASQTIGSLAGAGSVTLGSNTLTSNQSGNTRYDGVLAGAGSLTKDGAGTLTVTGANTYTGGTNLNGGVLNAGSTETAGTSGPLGNSGAITFGGGTLQYSANNNSDYSGRFATTAQPISIDTNGRAVSFGTTLMSGTAGSLTLTDTAITKGTLTLPVANTFTGATIIKGGTLSVDVVNALQSTSAITVNNGGTLLLTGDNVNRVNDAATITLAGGKITAGTGEGTGGTNTGGNNTGGNPSASGSVAGLGALTLTATGSTLDFGAAQGTLTFTTFNSGGFTLSITNYVSGANGEAFVAGGNSGVDGINDRLIFNTTQADNLANFFFVDQGVSGYQIPLDNGFYEIVPVPEPSTILAGLLTLGTVGYSQRRRVRGLLAAARRRTRVLAA